MTNQHGDIKEDEIRIISSGEHRRAQKKYKKLFVWLCGIAALLIIAGLAVLFIPGEEATEETFTMVTESPAPRPQDIPAATGEAYTEKCNTLVNDVELSILTPYNATPTLEIGNAVLNDSTAVLVAQAADIRGDNGMIVGSFVLKGELISKGEAKAGFCSIINDKISVGVADATPMFEQALTSNGYFFRQYPLVVGGQIVENKPKGKAVRKALAETDGRISVIISNNRVSFHDFSQALVNAGVRNAIYLVGSDSYGSYLDKAGTRFIIGRPWADSVKNVNYIVWR